jgi:hypothetical protein
MAKIQLVDKDNNIVEFDHSVDAREALMSGHFFEVQEVVKEVKRKEEAPYKTKEELKQKGSKTKKVPEPEETPVEETHDEDIKDQE